MNYQIKQRVVGAIVLVSLAIIFIPLILPGKGDLSGDSDSSNIPAQPDYRFPTPKQAPLPPVISKSPPVPVEPSQADSKAPAAETVKPEPPAPKPDSNGKPPVASKAPVATASNLSDSAEEKTDQVSAWVVQVGSFSSQANATAMRDRLRSKGYASFVEAVKGQSGLTYRVRVGPELTPELAERLKEKLFKQEKIEGLVQRYP